MRKTIEDLTVEKTLYKRGRDAFGNRTKEPYQGKIKRPVKVVQGWTRFGHYLIDAIIIGIISFFIQVVAISGGLDTGYSIRFGSFQYTISIANYFIIVGYYFLCELTMQRTIGKFATDSVVINEFAEPPGSESLIARSFSRIVPFEAFSCLSERGWHDKWSKTYVVKQSEQQALKRLLNADEGIFISDSEDLLD